MPNVITVKDDSNHVPDTSSNDRIASLLHYTDETTWNQIGIEAIDRDGCCVRIDFRSDDYIDIFASAAANDQSELPISLFSFARNLNVQQVRSGVVDYVAE